MLNLNDRDVEDNFPDEPVSSFPIRWVVGAVAALILAVMALTSYSNSARRAEGAKRAQEWKQTADDIQETNRQLQIENQKTQDEVRRLQRAQRAHRARSAAQ